MNSDFTTYNGQPLALCLAPINFAEAPELTLAVDRASVAKAISARERRKRFARTALYSPDYTAWLGSAQETTDFKLWLLRVKGTPVGVPLWNDRITLSAAATVGATNLSKISDLPVRSGLPWIVLADDGSRYEIVNLTYLDATSIALADPGLVNAWPSGTHLYPLLIGRFDEWPKVEMVTPDKGSVELKLRESSGYANRITPQVQALPVVGANIAAFATYPLWNIHPNWNRPLETEEVDEIAEQIGALREEQRYVYPQPARRGFEMEFVATSRADILRIERFFYDRYGPTKPFFLPSFDEDFELAANLPNVSNTQQVTIKDSRYLIAEWDTHPGSPYLALVEPGPDGAIDPHKVTLIDGLTNTLTLEHAVTLAHTTALTRVSRLVLVRFADPELKWSYAGPNFATCTLKFIEVPDEYVTPNPELPERARVYQFIEQRNPDDSATWITQNFTSYETSLSYGGNTAASAPFSHGEIPNMLDLSDKVELRSFDFPDNPLRKLLTQRLEGNLICSITDVSATSPNDGTARILFTGYVVELDPTGPQWKAQIVWKKHVLDRPVPGVYKQAPCNTSCYSVYCGLSEASFRVAGNITFLSDTEVHVAAGADKPVDWFAGGGKVRRGMGTTTCETRGVLHSEPLGDGSGVKLIIDEPFWLGATGQSAQVTPTCSLMLDDTTGRSCIAFGNGINYRGFFYTPPELLNPAGQSAETAGGKK